MLHDKWAISDHHLFHTNMLKFTREDGSRCRPFNSLEEQHEIMIERHNAVVKDQDYVYFGGDVTFQYHAGFNEVMSRLKGRKRLCIGNHDKIWNPNLMKWFEKAFLWHGFKEFNFTLSHMPLKEGSFRDGAFNVHGHTHWHPVMLRDTKAPDPRYINICVEPRNFTPVNFDTIRAEIAKAS